jgi:hypothetical protein
VAALVYFGLDETEGEKAPPVVLGTRGSEAVDPSSPAGAGTRESRLAAAREKDRGDARGRLDRGADAPAGEAIPYEQGFSRAAAERLGTEGRTAAGARAPRAREGTPDRPENQADQAAIDAFVRAVRAELDAAPGDDRVALEVPGERDDEGDQGLDDVSAPTLEGVWVGSPVMVTCPGFGLCDFFPFGSIDLPLPGTIRVVSGGNEAILVPAYVDAPDTSDVVYIRTTDGIIQVLTENLTNSQQLDALVRQLVPSP